MGPTPPNGGPPEGSAPARPDQAKLSLMPASFSRNPTVLRHAALGVFHLGVLAQISDKDDFIDAFSCHECCSFHPWLRRENRQRN